MDVYSRHAESLKAVQRRDGDACPWFSWKGPDGLVVRVSILPGSLVRGKDLGAGGFKLRADLRFVVVASDLPDPGPEPQQTIEYLGKPLRIDTIETLAGATLLRFECNDAYQAT
jgi:hypothetical protein